MRVFLLIPLLFLRLALCAQTWSPVGSGIKGSFTQLITCNHKLYASGIDSLNNKPAHVAYWDSIRWHAADSGLNGTITAMAVYEGKLYAGTTEKKGANAVYRLMYWNDTLWNRVSTLNGPINALCTYKGSLLAGGKFTMADTTPVKYIARWNDTTWHAVGKNISNNVRTIAVFRSKIYVGGQFGGVMCFNGKYWETAQGNKTMHMNEWVKALYLYNDELYACGEFNYFVKWDNSDWVALGILGDGANTMATYNSSIYIGGDFTSVPNNNYVNHIAEYDGPSSTWTCLGGVLYSAGDCKPYTGTVWSLAEYKGDLYVGGQFMIAGGKIICNIARLNVSLKQQ